MPARAIGAFNAEAPDGADDVYADLYKCVPETRLIYVTPEKVARSDKLLRALAALHGRGLLRRFVIDEAHCISAWRAPHPRVCNGFELRTHSFTQPAPPISLCGAP